MVRFEKLVLWFHHLKILLKVLDFNTEYLILIFEQLIFTLFAVDNLCKTPLYIIHSHSTFAFNWTNLIEVLHQHQVQITEQVREFPNWFSEAHEQHVAQASLVFQVQAYPCQVLEAYTYLFDLVFYFIVRELKFREIWDHWFYLERVTRFEIKVFTKVGFNYLV